MALKLWTSLVRLNQAGKPLVAFDVLDPLQAVVSAPAAGAAGIYVSGWQSAAMGTPDAAPGPDLADLPHNYVAKNVARITRAQRYHMDRWYESRIRHALAPDGSGGAALTTSSHAPSTTVYTPQTQLSLSDGDLMIPVIADGDSGHGGITTVMRMVRQLIEAGASAVHFEDQKIGAKLGGPIAGAVLCSPREHITRLVAARLQADMALCPLIIIARTDALNAAYVDTNADPSDHMFILGTTNPMVASLSDVLAEAQRSMKGKPLTPSQIAKIHATWEKRAQLCTYPEAVERAILSSEIPLKEDALKIWRRAMSRYYTPLQSCAPSEISTQNGTSVSPSLSMAFTNSRHDKSSSDLTQSRPAPRPLQTMSLRKARQLALRLGVDPHWDWEKPRSVDGLYRIQGGELLAVERARRYRQYSDVIWLGCPGIPSIQDASAFAQKLASYEASNMAPSRTAAVTQPQQAQRPLLLCCAFSAPRGWAHCGLENSELTQLSKQLAGLNFTLQLLPAAGFHASARGAGRLAAGLGTDGISGYVDNIWPEKDLPDQQLTKAERILQNVQASTAAQNGWTGAMLIHSVSKAVHAGEHGESEDRPTAKTREFLDTELISLAGIDVGPKLHKGQRDVRPPIDDPTVSEEELSGGPAERMRASDSLSRWQAERQALRRGNSKSPGDAIMGSEEVYAEAFE